MLEWDVTVFSRGSSQPRDQTPSSCIAGRFLTLELPKEAARSWSGLESSLEAAVGFLFTQVFLPRLPYDLSFSHP